MAMDAEHVALKICTGMLIAVLRLRGHPLACALLSVRNLAHFYMLKFEVSSVIWVLDHSHVPRASRLTSERRLATCISKPAPNPFDTVLGRRGRIFPSHITARDAAVLSPATGAITIIRDFSRFIYGFLYRRRSGSCIPARSDGNVLGSSGERRRRDLIMDRSLQVSDVSTTSRRDGRPAFVHQLFNRAAH